MLKNPSALNNESWGAHLNFEEHFTSPPAGPDWLTPLQQQDWQRRGIVVWVAELRLVTHLYAGYALDVLDHMRGATEEWKTSGFLIGSLMYRLSTISAGDTSPKIGGTWILENQLELRADQVQNLVEFLTVQESLLKRISLHDKVDAEEALSKVYQLIAAYGRKVREGKKSDKLIEATKPYILPFFIPRGNYFTVHQAAQICHATSKQIRAWIRKGTLEALDLTGLGIIIEAKKLNEFLWQRNS
jgi:hypothetical protein